MFVLLNLLGLSYYRHSGFLSFMKKTSKKNKEAQTCEDCGRKTSKGKRIMFTDRYLDETYDLWFCKECAKKYKGGKNI